MKLQFKAQTIFSAILIAAISIIMAGCTQNIALRKAPSLGLMEAIKSNESKSVAYTFESELPDPGYSSQNSAINKVNIDLNNAYASNLEQYMNNKYSIIEEAEGYEIDVILQSCDVEVAGAGTQTVQARYSDGSSGTVSIQNVMFTTKIGLKVTVSAKGEKTEKKIMAMGEFTGSNNDFTIVKRSFELAIEKSILMIDKFLDKTFGDEQ